MINDIPGQLSLFKDPQLKEKFVSSIFDHDQGPDSGSAATLEYRDGRDCKYNFYFVSDFFKGHVCRTKGIRCEGKACDEFKFFPRHLKCAAHDEFETQKMGGS